MSRPPRVQGRTPLVGRIEEIRQLELCWNQASAGHGKAVLISGEAGIGKSRLAIELEDLARADGSKIMRFQCSPLQTNSEFHPVLDHLTRLAGARRTEPDHLRYAKIQKLLASTSLGVLPEKLINGLLMVGGGPAPTTSFKSPRRQRDELMEALIEGVTELTITGPLFLVVEDAQWLDPTTRELVDRLVDRAATLRLLLLVTARRDYAPEWVGAPNTSVIIPRRLGQAETLKLTQQSVARDDLSPAELQQIVDRSEGVPLFVEELSKDKPPLGAELPETATLSANLQAHLMARLNGLGPAKYAAQVAAALGRSFDHDVLAAVCGGTAIEFEQIIVWLMAAEILLAKPIEPGAHYSFRHALLQEATYASLLPHHCAVIHGQIADVLAAVASDTASDQAEIMAHHNDRAGRNSSAAASWLAAGNASAARGSITEAANAFELGLASLQRAPADDQRDRLEFELLLGLGPAQMARNGYASSEGLVTFQRARALLEQSRTSLEEIHVLLGLFNVHFGRGDFPQALEVGRQAHSLLSVGFGGYPVLMGQAHCMMGNLREAHRDLEEALAKYNPTLDEQSGLFCTADIVATAFLAKVEFAFGNLDRASELTRATMDLAQQQGHPLALALAYLSQLLLATEAGDWAQAQTIADEAYVHVEEHGLQNYRLWVAYHRAGLSLRTDPSAAIATMHQILQQADAAGTQMFRPAQLGLLGAAYAGIGRQVEALAFIDQGLAVARQTHGLEAAPALHRLRAKILVESRRSEAVQELETSLVMARQQGALLEQLRSATLLANILKQTDRQGYATELLSSILGTFTEGQQFPDLRHASRTLASLSAST